MGFAVLSPSYGSGAAGWAERSEAHHPPTRRDFAFGGAIASSGIVFAP